MAWITPPDGFITPHFRWREEAACRHCGRVPSLAAVQNTARWLENIREHFGGKPIIISSWCRCPYWNKRVGGASRSYHMRGWAVDFNVKGLPPRQVQAELLAMRETLKVGGIGAYHSWSHADRGKPRTWQGP